MEKEIVKEKPKQLNNLLYKERFQFILKINDDIICQRFFRINGLSYESLESEEMKLVMDEVVNMIQNDLVSKSRVYDWYSNGYGLKLTGFVNDIEKYDVDDRMLILSNSDKDDDIICKNGDCINKTYFKYSDGIADMYVDNERPADNEFVFNFSFLFDDKVMYERIWDANIYHKYVRNGVDLTNSDIAYKDKDSLTLPFNLSVLKAMTNDKIDLVYHIIKKICGVLSATYTEEGNEYTKKVYYGDKAYLCSTYNKDFVNNWRVATEQKTKNYFNSMYPSDKSIEYIDKYL